MSRCFKSGFVTIIGRPNVGKSTFARNATVPTAIKEKEESEQLLEQKMERWFYLHDLAEQIEAQKQ